MLLYLTGDIQPPAIIKYLDAVKIAGLSILDYNTSFSFVKNFLLVSRVVYGKNQFSYLYKLCLLTNFSYGIFVLIRCYINNN